MKYIKGLTKRKLNKWLNKEWYHQRFDGAPYLIHMIGEAQTVVDIKKKQGTNFVVHYCFYEDGKADWYMEKDDIKKIYTKVISQINKDKNYSTKLIKKWDVQYKAFYDKCKEINKLNIQKLSDDELIKLHDEFLEIILAKNSSSSIIDGFALGTDELVADMIKKVYEKSKIKNEVRFSEVFSILTAPTHLSFINQAEIDLLNLAKKIKQGGNKKELLAKHQKKYFWIRNNYVDANILDVNYFAKEVNKILSIDRDIKDQIKDIKSTPEKNKRAGQAMVRKLKLDQKLKALLKTSDDFTYWQDERKRVTFFTAHYTYLILAEIAKRLKLKMENIKYLSPREVSTIFINKPTNKFLQERRKACVGYWDMEGHEILQGKDYQLIMDAILGKHDLSEVDDFRGLTARVGKARGKVKIIKSAKEVHKVEKGDILVAVMTRPDYIPAMKKAAAIVTDEGGITCHAAIVSRELGVPCIIGTKIATKALKDGMQVEVNANHGWVRILK